MPPLQMASKVVSGDSVLLHTDDCLILHMKLFFDFLDIHTSNCSIFSIKDLGNFFQWKVLRLGVAEVYMEKITEIKDLKRTLALPWDFHAGD